MKIEIPMGHHNHLQATFIASLKFDRPNATMKVVYNYHSRLMREWLEEHVDTWDVDRNRDETVVFIFTSDEDAALFKMKWG